MSLLDEQAAFLRQLRKLLDYADTQQLVAIAGELERTPETQAIYVRAGREKTMDSPHLRKCAITLSLFRQQQDRYQLVQSLAELEAIGTFWETLDARNRWGGRRGGVLQAQEFWRDPGGWPSNSLATLSPPSEPPSPVDAVAVADGARPEAVTLPAPTSSTATPLLKRGSLDREAVARLQGLLGKLGLLDPPPTGSFDDKTETAVASFQRSNNLIADGVVGEKTWTTLQSRTSSVQQAHADRFIGDADFDNAAKGLQIESGALRAVYAVESGGRGFVGDDPKILFEGHVFWARLKALGLRPESYTKGNEDILYPSFTKQFYLGGSREWTRLKRAEAIQPAAAQESASWGLFQIMGYHWKTLSYTSVDDYVSCMRRHERDQLDAFCRFIKVTRDGKGQTLLSLLAAKDWSAFALSYNGAAYRQNLYDDRLRDAYRKFQR